MYAKNIGETVLNTGFICSTWPGICFLSSTSQQQISS